MTSFYNRPALLLTLTSIFWAGNFVLGRAIVGHVPPVTLACLRWSLASLLFLPYALPYVKQDAKTLFEDWKIVAFLALVGPGFYNTLSYLGLLSTEALNGLVLNAAAPMFIALAAWSIFGDRVEAAQLAGLVAGFGGVVLIIAKGELGQLLGFHFNPGDILLIVGMICWSVYTTCLRKRPNVSWQSFNLVSYVIAAVVNLPMAVWEHTSGQGMRADTGTFAAIAYVAIFPSLLAYIFYNRGVELLGRTKACFFVFLVPVFVALLATVWLGETLYGYHVLGFGLIISGVLIGTLRRGPAPMTVKPAGE